MDTKNLRIVFACSEAVPFAKTGGMADVVGSLPGAISRLGHTVYLIMPCYGDIDRKSMGLVKLPGKLSVPMGNGSLKSSVYRSEAIDGVTTYLLDHPGYYRRDFLYGTPEGDYPDNDERFAFFSRGALEVIRSFSLEPDVVHCHDWQAGLIPVYLRTTLKGVNGFDSCSVFFTVHNLAYQGNFEASSLEKAGLPDWLFRTEKGLEFYGKVSYLKGGLTFSDIITTVSPTYSKEIQKDGLGFGFEGILRSRADSLHGIVNGIAYEEWNPETDPFLPVNYGPEKLSSKKEVKRALLEKCRLEYEESDDIMVMGLISRLAEQKGLDILSKALPVLFEEDVYFVTLGFGDKLYQDLLENLSRKRKDKLSVTFAFDNEFAHLIYAGSDVFLMPSRYEPCGLGQLISMKYGTPPLVRSTGGLKDTVTPFDRKTGFGTGLVFKDYSAKALVKEIKNAIRLYRNKPLWEKLVKNCMSQDYSWDASALQYIDLYRDSIERRHPDTVPEDQGEKPDKR